MRNLALLKLMVGGREFQRMKVVRNDGRELITKSNAGHELVFSSNECHHPLVKEIATHSRGSPFISSL